MLGEHKWRLMRCQMKSGLAHGESENCRDAQRREAHILSVGDDPCSRGMARHGYLLRSPAEDGRTTLQEKKAGGHNRAPCLPVRSSAHFPYLPDLSVILEQSFKFRNAQSRVPYDPCHCIRVDWIPSRDSDDPLPICHDDVPAFPGDPEARFLKALTARKRLMPGSLGIIV
jgi:hypothetical protein